MPPVTRSKSVGGAPAATAVSRKKTPAGAAASKVSPNRDQTQDTYQRVPNEILFTIISYALAVSNIRPVRYDVVKGLLFPSGRLMRFLLISKALRQVVFEAFYRNNTFLIQNALLHRTSIKSHIHLPPIRAIRHIKSIQFNCIILQIDRFRTKPARQVLEENCDYRLLRNFNGRFPNLEQLCVQFRIGMPLREWAEFLAVISEDDITLTAGQVEIQVTWENRLTYLSDNVPHLEVERQQLVDLCRADLKRAIHVENSDSA